MTGAQAWSSPSADPAGDIRTMLARGFKHGLGRSPGPVYSNGALPGLYRAGFETRDLEDRLERRARRRMDDRKMTRVEWLAWRHWMRVRYGMAAHRHDHRDEARIRAYADLTFAINAAETREFLRASMPALIDVNRRMTMAFLSLRPVLVTSAAQIRAAFADCSGWRITREREAQARLELHFELCG